MMWPTTRRHLHAAVSAAAVAGVLATGCDDDSPSEPREFETDDLTMEVVREQTTTATREVADVLESIGLTASRAIGGPDMCTDDGSEWRLQTETFVELPDGHEAGSFQLAEEIRGTLATHGWRPYESDGSYERGIDVEGEPGENLWIVRVQRNDVQDVLIYLWDYRPYLRADILGQCVPATENERDAYIAEDRQPISLESG